MFSGNIRSGAHGGDLVLQIQVVSDLFQKKENHALFSVVKFA